MFRYFNTIKHLKPVQIYYRCLYYVRRVVGANHFKHVKAPRRSVTLIAQNSIPSNVSLTDNVQFSFLNKVWTFQSVPLIDWNFNQFGKLWCYNLNYFDFLHQPRITKDEGLLLISTYIASRDILEDGLEPYPISLRNINWIKFLNNHNCQNNDADDFLWSTYRHLVRNLEYHLMGNHLLENAFSLLFGAYHFRDSHMYLKAKKLLKSELNEQVLSDGAHFELSPMYHQIVLYRLLDSINLVKNNAWRDDSLLPFLNKKASVMIGWLKATTFKNGDTPMVNDSAYDIAPRPKSLQDYGERLGVTTHPATLSDSGYRMIRTSHFELFLDAGDIGPDYIPGHAHSDTFNFVLHDANGLPLIVDTGTSTYEIGSQRTLERSTRSHNTVIINNCEQTEVWAGFRVGRRAKIIERYESLKKIKASHNGYKSIGITHSRTWEWTEEEIKITDLLLGAKARSATAFLHFHPEIDVKIKEDTVFAGPLEIRLAGHSSINIEEYLYAAGFNKTIPGKVVGIDFRNELVTRIAVLGSSQPD